MKREFSAGGAVSKKMDGEVLWLVRRSKPSDLYPEENRWTLPKGWVEEGESVAEGAKREVGEEAGVAVEVLAKVEDQKFVYTPRGETEKTFKVVTYFLMEYKVDLAEGFGQETAEVVWLPFEEARKRLIYSSEKKVLDKARERIKNYDL